MAVPVWEFQSFLGKFTQLTDHGSLSTLSFNNNGDTVTVNLSSTFSTIVQTPETSSPAASSKCVKPSRMRRRKRRQDAGLNKSSALELNCHDVDHLTEQLLDAGKTLSPVAVAECQDDPNCSYEPNEEEIVRTKTSINESFLEPEMSSVYADVEFGEGISMILADILPSSSNVTQTQ